MLPAGLMPNLGSELDDVLAAPEQRKSLFRTPHGTSESMGRKHPLEALSTDILDDKEQASGISDLRWLTDKVTAPHGSALSTFDDSASRPNAGFTLSRSLTKVSVGKHTLARAPAPVRAASPTTCPKGWRPASHDTREE
jgi:hypothetical protein